MKISRLLITVALTVVVLSAPIMTNAVTVPPDHASLLLGKINDYRTQNGLRKLEVDDTLKNLAIKHSMDMGMHKKLTHTSSDGTTFEQRMKKSGLKYTTAVENVASNKGYRDYAQVCFDSWKNSPPHKANMLNTEITHAGVALAQSSDGTMFATFDAMGLVGSAPKVVNKSSTKVELLQNQKKIFTVQIKNTTKKTILVNTIAVHQSGSGWLSVTPSKSYIASEKSISFIVTVSSGTQKSGIYKGKIRFTVGNELWDYWYELKIMTKTSSTASECDFSVIWDTKDKKPPVIELCSGDEGVCTFLISNNSATQTMTFTITSTFFETFKVIAPPYTVQSIEVTTPTFQQGDKQASWVLSVKADCDQSKQISFTTKQKSDCK